jgi:hypothetical protein
VQGAPVTFADGTVLGDGAMGGGVIFTLAKEGGKHWLWDVTYDGMSKKVHYDDAGFMRRQNSHHGVLGIVHRTLDPWGPTLETWTRADVQERDALSGLNLQREVRVNTWWRLKSFWQVFGEMHYRAAHFDDREVGDGAALERAGLVGHELAVSTDPRRRVSVGAWMQNQFLGDGHQMQGDARLTLRVLPQLDVELLPQFSYTNGEPRYVDKIAGSTGGTDYRFGALRAKSLGATLRATYTFTPRLSLQTYAQLFLASGHYSDFQVASADAGAPPPVVHLRDLRQAAAAPSSNPDFREGVLNVNVVLRWEYLLGSTMFLVYTRSQAPVSSLANGQIGRLDLGAVRRAPAADVLLLKLSYWWG